MGVLCVGQQMNVKLGWDVAERWNLVLGRPTDPQNPVWGELQLLDGVESDSLGKPSLHLPTGK